MTELQMESVLIQVKAKLHEVKMKLWLPPYYVDGVGTADSELERLAFNFSQMLGISVGQCLAALKELQLNAIEKLKARKDFNETGLATIKVRSAGITQGQSPISTTVSVTLSITGEEFERIVANAIGVQWKPFTIKIISGGSVIDTVRTLQEQNIQNNQNVLVIRLEKDSEEHRSESQVFDKIKKIRKDAELVVNGDQFGNLFVMEDQDGNAVHLPVEEKKSLMLALALHEKGKVFMKKGSTNEALIIFLEADQQYKYCNAKLLDSVDNFALLNLDIAWCYLLLRSVTHLHDAEQRLKVCKQKLNKSYGNEMRRVMDVKGNTSNEKVLLLRLNILQAVLSYHKNLRLEASTLLQCAELDLQHLKINPNDVATMVEMGYTETEARLSLRHCDGYIEQAINHIIERRHIRKKGRKRADRENQLLKEVSVFKDKTWIDPNHLEALIQMGFPKFLCALALKRSNNDVKEAEHLLQYEQPLLQQMMISEYIPNQSDVAQLISLGFHEEIAKLALIFSRNNLDHAQVMLSTMQSDTNYDRILSTLLTRSSSTNHIDSEMAALLENYAEIAKFDNTVPGQDNQLPSTSSNSNTTRIPKEALNNDVMDAYLRYSEDLSNIEDDEHLDSPLEEEERILNEYKNLM